VTLDSTRRGPTGSLTLILVLGGCSTEAPPLGAPREGARAPAARLLEVEVRARASGRAVPGAEVLFMRPGRTTSAVAHRARTDAEGRARSPVPAADVHVFARDFAQSVLGAPPRIEVVVPSGAPRREGVTVRGRVSSFVDATSAALVAVADGARLEGWAAGAADPAAGGRPTHLPRLSRAGGAGVSGEIAGLVGARADTVVAVLRDDRGMPVGLAEAALPAREPGAVIDDLLFVPRRPPRAIERVLFAPEERPRISAFSLHLQDRLRIAARRVGPRRYRFFCLHPGCALAVETQRRASLGATRGAVVEAQGRRLFEPAVAPLPVPARFERAGRVLFIPRGEEDATELVVRPGGQWRVLVLDGRARVRLPRPAGPDPLSPVGRPRPSTRRDFRWGRSGGLRATGHLRRRAEAWSRRTFVP
jgi:hypothetical protein